METTLIYNTLIHIKLMPFSMSKAIVNNTIQHRKLHLLLSGQLITKANKISYKPDTFDDI